MAGRSLSFDEARRSFLRFDEARRSSMRLDQARRGSARFDEDRDVRSDSIRLRDVW